MAQIYPFRALRFTEKAGDIAELTCPPYDIIPETQRLMLLKRNEHNIIRLELPRDGENPYAQAGETLNSWLNDGILKQDDVPALYVYELEFTVEGRSDISGMTGGRRSLAGMITRVKLEEFSKGIVLPHEETLSKAKQDRFNLMRATDCNFSNIYALYQDDGGESETLDILSLAMRGTPVSEMTDEVGTTHRLWAITDETTIAAIQQRFVDTKLYIADGHHRYETAINYRNECRAAGAPEVADCDYVMMMLVEMSHPGLVVLPTHRLLRDLPAFDPQAVLIACEDQFDILRDVAVESMDELLESAYQDGRTAFAFYTGGETFSLLTLKDASVMDALQPDCSDALRHLDVNVLHTLILERVLGIDKTNMAAQINLTYTHSLTEAIDNVRAGAFQGCFVMNPTRVEEIRQVSSAGEKMPQKSTYFYPKLITGLTMNKFDK